MKKNAYIIFSLFVVIFLIGAGSFLWFLDSKNLKRWPIKTKTAISTPAPIVSPSPSPADTTSWKTYRNEKYGFEFQYSKDFTLEEKTQKLRCDEAGCVGQPDYLTVNLESQNLSGEIMVNNPGMGFEGSGIDILNKKINIGGIQTEYTITEDDKNFILNPSYELKKTIFVSFQNKPNSYTFIFTYKKDGPEQKELVEKILSTFKFTEPSDTTGLSSEALAKEGWKTYRSENYHYEVSYPLDWVLKESADYAYGISLMPKDFQKNKRGMMLKIEPINWGTDTCLPFNNCFIHPKEVQFGGKKAKELTSKDTEIIYCRDLHITEIKDIGWGDTNQIGYCLKEDYKKLMPLYNQILSTFKFTQ